MLIIEGVNIYEKYKGDNIDLCKCVGGDMIWFCEDIGLDIKEKYKKQINIWKSKETFSEDWYNEYWCLTDLSINIGKLEHLHLRKTSSETWNYLTISPKPFLSENQLGDFERFITGIMNPTYIKQCYWVIESGKYEDNPNYHAHLLFTFNNAGLSKNFKRDCCRAFARKFKGFQIDWRSKNGVGWYNKIIRSTNNSKFKEILEDKKNYFLNIEKSVLHENFTDLNISGGF